MNIRPATPKDRLEIYNLLMEMYQNVEYNLPRLNRRKVADAIDGVVNTGVCFVAEQNGKVFGSIGGRWVSLWFSDDPVLGDLWYYVTPKKRGRASWALLKAFVGEAQKKGGRVQVGHVAGGNLELKDKFYSRVGLSRIGSIFVLEK